ncbi:hypothetical protein BN424_1317 [Carnobacterium maltaromaticum LMA28]|uniref:Uncharacterized protein n=2 Tax=Carnobacterium maltaromaticum TaxID=2751 RepID=K8E3I1_CARML|nr:hypothetical protein [Carnobacterium maltaromaticum]CCO10759.2 hypothetical protein BN424_1317 [Carnobacterium maltaromaticum LMA28]
MTEKDQLAKAKFEHEALVQNLEELKDLVRKQGTQRKLVESENIVLRKRLMDQKKRTE